MGIETPKLGLVNLWKSVAAIIIVFSYFMRADARAETDYRLKQSSLNYLSNIDQSEKLMIWPSYTLKYEVVNWNYDVYKSVLEYIGNRRDIFRFEDSYDTAQISIISISPGLSEKGMVNLLESSNLLQGYKLFAYRARLGDDGCTAYKFTSRETWAAVGIIFIDKKKFGIGNKEETDSCVSGTLDYIMGFPSKNRYFDYRLLPEGAIRKVILGAIYQCAADGDNESRREEATKDGLIPLPSLECVKRKIAE